MGLLEKAAETPPANPSFSDFQQWAEASPFAHCGVLRASPNFMLLNRAYGIDSETALNSISTRDFWAGSAAGDEWILLERGDGQFAGFLQFLGDDAKEKAEHIAILKLRENPPAFFLAYDTDSFKNIPSEENFRGTLLPILESEKKLSFREGDEKKILSLAGSMGALLFTVSLETVFQEIFSGDEKNFFLENPKAREILSNTIFEEFLFETRKEFSWPDFIFAKGFSKIKIAAILTKKNFEEIARQRILNAGKKNFPAPLAMRIEVGDFASKCGAREIISYILRG